MKAEIEQSDNACVDITLTAETAKEAASLVRLGMNMGAPDYNGPATSSIFVGDESVKLYASFHPTPSRRLKANQKTWVRFQR